MGGFRVDVNENDLARVTRKLHGMEKEARQAIRNAANDTAVKARKMLASEAQRRYTVKNGGFNDHAKLQRATLANLTAIIKVDGKPLTAPRFHISVSKRYGVKMEQLKGSGLKTLEMSGIKAFTGTGQISGAKLVLQRKGPSRLPVHGRYGSSVPKMIEQVYDRGGFTSAAMKDKITELYHQNLEKQIARVVA